MNGFRPSHLALGVDELERRADAAHALLGPRCVVCPRGCKVDRRKRVKGLCAIGRHAVVASYFPHFGEEDCLRGRNGVERLGPDVPDKLLDVPPTPPETLARARRIALANGIRHAYTNGRCEACETTLPGVFAGRPGVWGRRRLPVRLAR
jgi:hypothetical protein